jgi:hypothetical protein
MHSTRLVSRPTASSIAKALKKDLGRTQRGRGFLMDKSASELTSIVVWFVL